MGMRLSELVVDRVKQDYVNGYVEAGKRKYYTLTQLSVKYRKKINTIQKLIARNPDWKEMREEIQLQTVSSETGSDRPLTTNERITKLTGDLLKQVESRISDDTSPRALKDLADSLRIIKAMHDNSQHQKSETDKLVDTLSDDALEQEYQKLTKRIRSDK